MRKYSKRTAIVAVTAAVLLGTAGGAYAYWTSTGSGSGTAAAGTASTVTVNQTSSVAGLVPGGAAIPLSGTFTSTNNNVVVTGLMATVAVDKPACLVSDFVIAGTAVIVNDAPATYSKTWSGLTIKLNNTALNQDACKGAAVTINYATS